jgi:hypothetical protein
VIRPRRSRTASALGSTPSILATPPTQPSTPVVRGEELVPVEHAAGDRNRGGATCGTFRRRA